jgi:signal transduction histidine kinase
MFPFLTFGLVMFPDGELPTRRWRPAGWFAGGVMIVTGAATAWIYRPTSTVAIEVVEESSVPYLVLVLLLVVLIVGSLIALIRRFRRSSGTAREQIKWAVWGVSVFTTALTLAIIAGGTSYEAATTPVLVVAAAVFFASFGIAVGRYRLFDIDVVIRRTVVVAGLVGLITVVYAAVVGGVGLLFGSQTEAALPLSIAATVVVAIAFQPMQRRMRVWANRVVYGERATPYEVLSRFATRMRDAAATTDLIPQMARLLTDGTGAVQATVWMGQHEDLRPVATWPADRSEAMEGRTIGDVAHLAPVEHDGEVLGALTVTLPRGEELNGVERRLIDDVAAQAGLVLRNERLIQELRSSRQRLVAAHDEERRRLERDLHDGAQQELVALKLKLGLAQRIDDPAKRNELLGGLMGDADHAIESLRDLARGIYPPVLAQEGLVRALRGQAARAALPVDVIAEGVGRYPQEIEAAVYFCILEAVQNVAKYAEATGVDVTLSSEDGMLRFVVEDDGRGFDPDTVNRGAGLQNMEDRVEALGGRLSISSSPGDGTRVAGVISPTTLAAVE